MTTLLPLRRIALACALITLLSSPCAAGAPDAEFIAAVRAFKLPPPPPPPSAAHARHLREVVDALRYYESISAPPAWLAELSEGDREFDTAFRSQVTRAETYRIFEPMLAGYFNARLAGEFARLSRVPAFRKREMLSSENPGITEQALMAHFTPAERAELARIDATRAMKSYQAFSTFLHNSKMRALNRWAERFGRDLAKKSITVLRQARLDIAAAREARPGIDPPAKVVIGEVGVGFMDRFVRLSAIDMFNVHNSWVVFDNELKRIGFDAVLNAENLATSAKIARGKLTVNLAEAAVERLTRDIDATVQESTLRLRQISYPSHDIFIKHLDTGASASHAYILEVGEAYRRLLDVHRRTLVFIEARQGAFDIEGGKLNFQNDGDLATFGALSESLTVAEREVLDVQRRQSRREDELARDAGVEITPPSGEGAGSAP